MLGRGQRQIYTSYYKLQYHKHSRDYFGGEESSLHFEIILVLISSACKAVPVFWHLCWDLLYLIV